MDVFGDYFSGFLVVCDSLYCLIFDFCDVDVFFCIVKKIIDFGDIGFSDDLDSDFEIFGKIVCGFCGCEIIMVILGGLFLMIFGYFFGYIVGVYDVVIVVSVG